MGRSCSLVTAVRFLNAKNGVDYKFSLHFLPGLWYTCLRNKCHAISTICLQLRESVGCRYRRCVLCSYLEEALTHTVTHTTNCAERAKEHRRGNRFLSGEIPDILLRMVAVSSSGFSNIGWLLLTSVSHFSYCLSSCFISRDLFDSFYYVCSFWQGTRYFLSFRAIIL